MFKGEYTLEISACEVGLTDQSDHVTMIQSTSITKHTRSLTKVTLVGMGVPNTYQLTPSEREGSQWNPPPSSHARVPGPIRRAHASACSERLECFPNVR